MLALLLLLHPVISLEIAVIFSPNTPASLKTEISQSLGVYSLPFKWKIFEIRDELDERTLRNKLILDFTNSVVYSATLRRRVRKYGSLLLIPESAPSLSISEFLFYSHPQPVDEAFAILNLINVLGLDNPHIISAEDSHSTAQAHLLRELLHPSLNYEVISQNSSQTLVHNYVARAVKPSGNWRNILFSMPSLAEKYLAALKSAKIYKERCAFLVGSMGSWGTYDLGTILVVEAGLEGVKSQGEYEVRAIARMLMNLSGSSDLDEIKNILEIEYSNHSPEPVYSIINWQEEPVLVGSISNGSVILPAQIIYPGSVIELNKSMPVIQISGELGYFNYDNTFDPIAFQVALGVQPMLALANLDHTLLENFDLRIANTNCGPSKFLYSHYETCLSEATIGLFHLMTYSGVVTEGTFEILQKMNNPVPGIGPFYPESRFYDKVLFPDLTVVVSSYMYLGMIVPSILMVFDWTEIMLVYQPETKTELYQIFTQQCETYGIKIMNENREMYYNYTLAQYAEYSYVFNEIKNINSRVLVLFVDMLQAVYIAESLYMAGLRKNDLVIISMYSIEAIIADPAHDREKVLEIYDGSMSFSRDEYIGEFGEDLKPKIAAMIAPYSTSLTCFPIEQLLLGLHAVSMMSDLGRDYEDPDLLNYFIRMQRFTGCSGTLSIDNASNERVPVTYSINNFYVVNGTWTEVKIGEYTLGITIPLKFYEDMIFPDHTTEIPSILRYFYNECGFDPRFLEENENSKRLGITVIGSVCAVGLMLGAILWRLKFCYRLAKLDQIRDITFEDVMLMGSTVAEQAYFYALLGWDSNSTVDILKNLLDIDTTLLNEYTENTYWIFYIVTGGLSIFWVLSVGILSCGIDHMLPGGLKLLVQLVGHRLTPLFSFGVFLQVFNILTSVLDCQQGFSDLVGSTILKYDCNTSCWADAHVTVVILMSIGLAIFLPATIFAQPIINYTLYYTVVKVQPAHMLLRRAFLLSIGLTAKFVDSPELRGAVCTSLLFVWVLTNLKVPLSNYPRFNCWHCLLNLGILWASAWSLFMKYFPEYSLIYTAIVHGVMGVLILLTGLILQTLYFPSMLYRKPGRNIAKLFQFQLSNKIDPKDLTELELDYANRERWYTKSNWNPKWFINTARNQVKRVHPRPFGRPVISC